MLLSIAKVSLGVVAEIEPIQFENIEPAAGVAVRV